MNGPRSPTGGMRIDGVTGVAAWTLCDPGRRDEAVAVASCRRAGGARVGDNVVTMFLRPPRGTEPPGLGVWIRDVTEEARRVRSASPGVIGAVTELTPRFLGRGEGILTMPLVDPPVGGEELAVRIGGVTAETVFSVRFHGLEIGTMTGLARGGAPSVGRFKPFPVSACKRCPDCGVGVRKFMTGAAGRSGFRLIRGGQVTLEARFNAIGNDPSAVGGGVLPAVRVWKHGGRRNILARGDRLSLRSGRGRGPPLGAGNREENQHANRKQVSCQTAPYQGYSYYHSKRGDGTT